MINLPASTIDIGSMLSQENAKQREENQTMLLKIISSLCFLARQGLALRDDGREDDGNFIQLLKSNCGEGSIVTEWLSRRSNKYTSHEIQNEILTAIYVQSHLKRHYFLCANLTVHYDHGG